jgi:hypothetical protein
VRVRMEACARARVVRLSEEGYSRHVGLTGMAFSWKLLVGVVPGIRALNRPPFSDLQRSRLALLKEISPTKQRVASLRRVVVES